MTEESSDGGTGSPFGDSSPDRQAGRFWGVWTRGKLDVLRKYLEAFAKASQRAPNRVYLDLFAGQLANFSRETETAIEGSAEIALTVPQPPFTHYFFFERPRKARSMTEELSQRFPGRNIRVYPGDCNETIARALNDMRPLRRAPTFALIDPNAVDVRWPTLEALANHKASGLTKVEMWLLFPHAMFTRMLTRDPSLLTNVAAAKMTGLFGCEDWRPIYDMRIQGHLDPVEAREEYVNLMRWLMERRLNYLHTFALAIREGHGRPLYDMIFATDSPVGEKIMLHLHEWASEMFPVMRAEAKRRIQDRRLESLGQGSLFGPDEGGSVPRLPRASQVAEYMGEPPWLPVGQKLPEDE